MQAVPRIFLSLRIVNVDGLYGPILYLPLASCLRFRVRSDFVLCPFVLQQLITRHTMTKADYLLRIYNAASTFDIPPPTPISFIRSITMSALKLRSHFDIDSAIASFYKTPPLPPPNPFDTSFHPPDVFIQVEYRSSFAPISIVSDTDS